MVDKVTEETLDDRNCDFPRLDPRLEGQHNRFGYSTEFADGPGLAMKQLIKYDLDARKTETHDFGDGVSPGEGVFAATAPDSGEDEGFIRVDANVPLAEMFGYASVLRSSTQGKAEFSMEFARYAPAPSDVTEELVRVYQEKKAAGNK